MNVSLVTRCVRQARHGGNRVFLPVRSVTRLQRSRPLPQCNSHLWTLGASRSFSWNPFGGALKTSPPVQPPAPEIKASPRPEVEGNIAATTQATPQPTESLTSTVSDASTSVDGGALETLTDSITSAAATLATHPLPTQYGDMATLGLVSMWPPGWFPWLLEFIQVSTSLPWWSTIVLTTIGVRVALLPLVIRTQRNQARMAPLQPKLTELRNRMNKAKTEGDAFAQRQALQEQALIFKKNNISLGSSGIAAFSQAFIQIGFFIGLRRMCVAPVEQLKFGGFSWITDLAATDPLYILPLINFAAINLQLRISRRDMLATGTPTTPHILNGFQLFSPIMALFVVYLPVGLNLHIITSVLCISMQTLILRIPAIRKMVSLPPLPPPPLNVPGMRDTWASIRAWYRRQIEQAERSAVERERKLRMAQKHQRR